jgi:hypothetical protein
VLQDLAVGDVLPMASPAQPSTGSRCSSLRG